MVFEVDTRTHTLWVLLWPNKLLRSLPTCKGEEKAFLLLLKAMQQLLLLLLLLCASSTRILIALCCVCSYNSCRATSTLPTIPVVEWRTYSYMRRKPVACALRQTGKQAGTCTIGNRSICVQSISRQTASGLRICPWAVRISRAEASPSTAARHILKLTFLSLLSISVVCRLPVSLRFSAQPWTHYRHQGKWQVEKSIFIQIAAAGVAAAVLPAACTRLQFFGSPL